MIELWAASCVSTPPGHQGEQLPQPLAPRCYRGAQWPSVGEPRTRCEDPSVAMYPFSVHSHVLEVPASNRVNCSGACLASICGRTGDCQTVFQAKQRTCVPDLTCSGIWPVSTLDTRKAAFQFRDSSALAGFYHSALLAQSVLSCTATEVRDRAGSPGRAHSAVRLVYANAQVGYVWYHKVFI